MKGSRVFFALALLAVLLGAGVEYNRRIASEAKNGFVRGARYDWWWHSLVARSTQSGQLRAFFFEYYAVNSRGSDISVVEKQQQLPPRYAMVLAGAWGTPGVVLRSFHPIADFRAAEDRMDVAIGAENAANETFLRGSVAVAEADPLRLTTPGALSWALHAKKLVVLDANYPTGRILRALPLFQMFWHAQGMLTRYSGEIFLNGERFVVDETCPDGYADKNWGSGYTNPWIWLSCNNLATERGKPIKGTSFLLGGGAPVVLGVNLGRKALAQFVANGTTHEFQFARPWLGSSVRWDAGETDERVYWTVDAENPAISIHVDLAAPKAELVLMRYDEPAGGALKHTRLWNGGSAAGLITVHDKATGATTVLHADWCGCEYGAY